MSECVGTQAVAKAYHTYIRYSVSYNIIIFWVNSAEVNIIFSLQKKCLRTIFKMRIDVKMFSEEILI